MCQIRHFSQCRVWFRNFSEFLRSFLPSHNKDYSLLTFTETEGCTIAGFFLHLPNLCICKRKVHSWTVLHLVGRSKEFPPSPSNVFDQPNLHGEGSSGVLHEHLTSHVNCMVHCSLNLLFEGSLGQEDWCLFIHNPTVWNSHSVD